MMEHADRRPLIALTCGVLAVLCAFFAYWMLIPSIGLGLAAIVIGMRSRGGDALSVNGREFAAAAIALGLVGILGTGGTFITSEWAEDWGRDCALNPNPDC